MSFWRKLDKGFTVLAPMEDVTDTVFRRVIAKAGRPDVFFTEFTNCEGMQSAGMGAIAHRLKYSKSEKPIVAQIWGTKPEDYYKTTKTILELGFDGVDINMGCPVKNVVKQGACSALIKNPSLAKEIYNAVKEATDSKIPVSIKTRIGFDKIQTEEWIGFLFNECSDLEALTIHGRTAKEESNVPCHYDQIARVVSLREEIYGTKRIDTKKRPLIIANGDITTLQQSDMLVKDLGVDGVMIGRGVFQNPYIFNRKKTTVSLKDRFDLLNYHLELWEKTWGEAKNYNVLKKYFKIYLSNFHNSAEIRSILMETKDLAEAKDYLSLILKIL